MYLIRLRSCQHSFHAVGLADPDAISWLRNEIQVRLLSSASAYYKRIIRAVESRALNVRMLSRIGFGGVAYAPNHSDIPLKPLTMISISITTYIFEEYHAKQPDVLCAV